MTSTRWTWVWVNSGSWWGTGRPGVLRFMGSQRVGHTWTTDLIWSDLKVMKQIDGDMWPAWKLFKPKAILPINLLCDINHRRENFQVQYHLIFFPFSSSAPKDSAQSEHLNECFLINPNSKMIQLVSKQHYLQEGLGWILLKLLKTTLGHLIFLFIEFKHLQIILAK